METPTLAEVERVAAKAEAFRRAHEHRRPGYEFATLNERETLALLYAELRAALFPAERAA